MPKFDVTVYPIHTQTICEIEAPTIEEAIQIAWSVTEEDNRDNFAVWGFVVDSYTYDKDGNRIFSNPGSDIDYVVDGDGMLTTDVSKSYMNRVGNSETDWKNIAQAQVAEYGEVTPERVMAINDSHKDTILKYVNEERGRE